jgi:ubiquinone/menaquinone biosynthesis C-methylase UbiE
MKINTNTWNKLRYTFYTPVYDSVGRLFNASRRKAISALNIKSGEKVLLVGAGTGLDIEFIPAGALVTATDLTPSMVGRIKKHSLQPGLTLEAMVMDGQKLDFPDNYFDKVILHLIIAVIPDPVACLREAERVLKPGGKISVFDKFVRANHRASFLRKLLNPLTNLLVSDITRSFETIIATTGLRKISDTPANFHGNFRIILVEKPVI